MALKKIILNAEEINLPTKLSDLENDLGLGGGDIDTSNFATKETVMTSEIAVYADGFRTSNGDWFAFPGTESENNADFCIAIVDDIPTKTSQLTNDSNFITTDDIPKEVELINIAGDMFADEPTYTATEVQAIIDAYNANKLIVIKCRTRLYYGRGWFIPNISIRTQSGMSQIFLSSIIANYYIEHRILFDASVGTVSTTVVSLIDLSEIGGSSEGGSSAYAEVDHGTSDTTFELTPNTFHVWDEVASLDLSLGAETLGIANEYLFQFTSGSTPTTLTLPDDIKFSEDLVIEANKIYQISILKGLGSVLSWDNVTLIENKATYNEGDFMNGGTLTFEYPTASEINLYLDCYSSPYLTIPTGTTTIAIDWSEPSAPVARYFDPSFDDTYIYIIA